MSAARASEIQAVLFDWDGTLLDSYQADSSAYLTMFQEMGIPWGLAELALYYSPNWYDVYRAAGLARQRWKDADNAWRREYANHQPKLIGGVRQVLANIRKKYRLGLVTSGDRNRITRQLRHFGMSRLFPVRVCGGDTLRKKPHPAPLKMALEQLRLKPSACVYVGDAPEDMEMARRAGVRAIGVIGPFPTETRLRAAQPEFLLSSINKLPQALRLLETRKTKVV